MCRSLNSVFGFEIGLLSSNFLQQVCRYFFYNANKFQSRFTAIRFKSGRKNRNFGDFSDLEIPEDIVHGKNDQYDSGAVLKIPLHWGSVFFDDTQHTSKLAKISE